MATPASSRTVRSAGVRRLLQEAAELEADDCRDYQAAPLEDDLFQWHFSIRGPGAEFEGGVYHGRMVLPSEYPFKPPEIYMATPSGRFEINKKICLSISSFHPETWQPSWGIRTALLALTAFFTTEAGGAVGSMDAPVMERKRLAKASNTFQCTTCGFDAKAFPPAANSTPSPPYTADELSELPSPADPASEASTVPSSPSTDETLINSPASNVPTVAVSLPSGPSDVIPGAGRETTAIFPPAPSPRATGPPPTHAHHQVQAPREAPPSPAVGIDAAGNDAGVGGGGGAMVQVQHRPPAPLVLPQAGIQGSLAHGGPGGAVVGGGPPLWIDRAILAVLLALLAAVVRKLA